MPLVLLVRTPQFRAFVLSPSSSFFEHAYASLLAIIATVDSILLTFVVVRPSTSYTPLVGHRPRARSGHLYSAPRRHRYLVSRRSANLNVPSLSLPRVERVSRARPVFVIARTHQLSALIHLTSPLVHNIQSATYTNKATRLSPPQDGRLHVQRGLAPLCGVVLQDRIRVSMIVTHKESSGSPSPQRPP